MLVHVLVTWKREKEFANIQISKQGNQRYLMDTKLRKFLSNSGNSRNF